MSLDLLIAGWWSWMTGVLWQGGLVVLAVALVDRLTRRRLWPQVLGVLWLLAALKLFLPPTLASPTSLTATFGAPPSRMVTALTHPRPQTVASEPALVRTPFGGMIVRPQAAAQGAGRPAWYVRDTLFLVWLAGALLLGWRTWRRRRAFLRRMWRLDATVPREIVTLLDTCRAQLGLRSRPAVRLTRAVDAPAVCGALRPLVLLPADAAGDPDLGPALLHELVHLRHRDPWIEAGLSLLQIVYWPIPFVPLLRRQVLAWREVECDTAVARLLAREGRTTTYRDVLVSQVRRLVSANRAAPVALGLGGDAATLALRLDWLDRGSWKTHGRRRVLGVAVGLAMLICVLPMATWTTAAAVPRADAATAGPGCLHLRYAAMADVARSADPQPSTPLPESPSP